MSYNTVQPPKPPNIPSIGDTLHLSNFQTLVVEDVMLVQGNEASFVVVTRALDPIMDENYAKGRFSVWTFEAGELVPVSGQLH